MCTLQGSRNSMSRDGTVARGTKYVGTCTLQMIVTVMLAQRGSKSRLTSTHNWYVHGINWEQNCIGAKLISYRTASEYRKFQAELHNTSLRHQSPSITSHLRSTAPFAIESAKVMPLLHSWLAVGNTLLTQHLQMLPTTSHPIIPTFCRPFERLTEPRRRISQMICSTNAGRSCLFAAKV